MSELVTTPPPAHRACPGCQAPLPCYDPAHSTHFACRLCHTFFSQQELNAPVILKRLTKVPPTTPILPLGSTGTLPDGLEYRITGYMLRKEASSPAQWQEFMLFHPEAGYAQLAVYAGHWTFIQPTDQKYTNTKSRAGATRQVEADGVEYNIYNRYQPRILNAAGEFDWNIFDDEKLTITELIAPPLMLVEEKAKGRPVQWYRAQHVEPGQVAEAFGLTSSQVPFREGAGAVEPSPEWQPILSFTLLMLALVFVTHIFLINWHPEQQLVAQTFQTGSSLPTAPDGMTKVLVSPSFDVQHGPTTLYFELKTTVDNSWLELPVSLVDEQTGRGYEFTKNIEYYHGYEGGESWAEGSWETDAVLAQIPAGRYHLNLYPVTENNRPASIIVTVTGNAWLTSNYFLFSLLLLVFPAFRYWRRGSHEWSRWEQSNFDRPTS